MKRLFMIPVLILFLCGCADGSVLTEIPENASLAVESEVISGEEKTQEPEYSFLDKQVWGYAGQMLTETQQIWYQDIAECLGTMQSGFRLDKVGIEQGLDENDIDKIFQCVMNDHPELFYVEGYTYTRYERGDKLIAIDFAGTYSMDEATSLQREAEIKEASAYLLVQAGGLIDEYDKVKYVYDALIKNTEYRLDAPDNQNIYSVFVNKQSVCQGYAKAAQYLFDRMGIQSTLVQGTVDSGERHAWNLVKVNGAYYYVDVTWGDASYQTDSKGGNDNSYVPEINYDYLCVTTEQLLRTHNIENRELLPECTADADNYYVRENTFFRENDKEKLRMLFQNLGFEGCSEIALKCADGDVYQQIWKGLIEEQDIFDYLPVGSESIYYTLNEKQLSMTFWVTNE